MVKRSAFGGVGLAAAVLWIVIGGCHPDDDVSCSPECPSGQVCGAQGACQTLPLEPFDGPVAPGRSVRLTMVGAQPWLAAIDPATNQLLVGPTDEGEPSFYRLVELGRSANERVALASSSETVAVAWLGAGGVYHVATHATDEPAERWTRLGEVRDPAQDYRGSQHFDIDINADAATLHLGFYDRQTHRLHEIHGPLDGGRWDQSTVDDPADQPDGLGCSEQRRGQSGRGIGGEPDLSIEAGETFVAYQDFDCGDLRLASRPDGAWQVSVIDTGDFERDDTARLTAGVTGRFASVDADQNGNLAIAYQDVTRGQLMVAYERQGQFRTELADPGLSLDALARTRKHLVGADASLVFDDRGIPWIGYLDATTARLQLAHRSDPFDDEGRWIHQTVDARPPTGFSTSLGFSPERGFVVAAEHLSPAPSGLKSKLQLVAEEAF